MVKVLVACNGVYHPRKGNKVYVSPFDIKASALEPPPAPEITNLKAPKPAEKRKSPADEASKLDAQNRSKKPIVFNPAVSRSGGQKMQSS